MKKFRKYISAMLSAFTVLTAFSGMTAVRAEASVPPRMCIDLPSDSSYVSGSVAVKGWSIDRSGIKNVSVYLNGKKAANAQTGLVRNDINKIFNQSGSYKNAKYSGFSSSLNISSYPAGTYQLKVVSTGNSGANISATKKITKVAPKICVDTPKGNSLKINSDLSISGWSLDAAGVKNVDISIDGKSVGNAKAGLSRPDVNNLVNGSGCYKNGDKSGFSYTLSYSSLAAGTHTLTVASFGTDGSCVSKSFTLVVTAPTALANIDSFSSKLFITDSLTVKGWSLSPSGVKSVEVYIGGKKAGEAKTGLVREDVNKIMNKNGVYKDAQHSGFSLTISNTASFAPGDYEIKVVSTDYSGKMAEDTITATKLPAKISLDSPGDGSTVTGDFTLSGWAIDAAGISKVQVFVDGALQGSADIGGATPDLEKTLTAYNGGNGYKNAASAGVSYTIKSSSISNGSHKIIVKATGNDGETVSASATVYLESAPALCCVDTPADRTSYTPADKSITISGWALSESGVSSIAAYIDDMQVQSVAYGLASDSGIIKVSGGVYSGDANARFKSDPVDITGLSIGKHTLKIVVTGNDGCVSSFMTTFYKSTVENKNTAYNISIAQLAKKNNVSANAVDPNAIIANDGCGLYEFMTLNYKDGISADALNGMLKNCGVLAGKGQVFLDAGKTYDVNPAYLVAHARLESGNGSSKLSKGVAVKAGTYRFSDRTITVNADGTYYNQFGIKADDGVAVNEGSAYAGMLGWNSVEASITGGAKWISNNYVHRGKPDQNTLYKMKWDPGYWDGTYGSCYEYATSTDWAHEIAGIMYQYKNIFDGVSLTYDIPQYN